MKTLFYRTLPYGIYFIRIFIGAFLITLYSCADKVEERDGHSNSQDTNAINEPNRLDKPQVDSLNIAQAGYVELDEKIFPTELDFYNELFARSSCNPLEAFVEITGPLDCAPLKQALIDFVGVYSSTSNLSYMPTKLSFNNSEADILIDLIRTYNNQNHYGFVFHYGYETQGNDRIVYILSKGTIHSEPAGREGMVEYCPFQNENNEINEHYVLLDPAGIKSYQIIYQNRFNTLKKAYLEQIKVKYNQVDIGVDVVENHPLMAYHEPEEFYDFYDLYDTVGNLHLYIGHGAFTYHGDNIPVHTPCFMFGDGNEFFVLDDDDNSQRGQAAFFNKALDLGRLCPPNCPTPAFPCLTQ